LKSIWCCACAIDLLKTMELCFNTQRPIFPLDSFTEMIWGTYYLPLLSRQQRFSARKLRVSTCNISSNIPTHKISTYTSQKIHQHKYINTLSTIITQRQHNTTVMDTSPSHLFSGLYWILSSERGILGALH
jgi:hypothetical protein